MRKVILLLMLIAGGAIAQIRPVATGSDPMQQSVHFAEGETVILETAVGFQITVALADKEKISSAAAGDSVSWQVSAPADGNVFYARPLGGAKTTNLSVISNRHRYSFLLVPDDKMTSTNPLMVHFIYPAEPARIDAVVAPATGGTTLYQLSGAAEARPARVSDDGEKTYVEWSPSQDLAAVYGVDTRGHETLVNGFFRDGRLVIDAVYSRLMFHLDDRRALANRPVVRR